MSSWALIRDDLTVAHISRAESFLEKGVGVLRLRSLAPGFGLWLPGVASVHTLFVRFSLDLIFFDADFRAVKLARAVPPNRFLVCCPGAKHVIELGAGTLTGIESVGEIWELQKHKKETQKKARKNECD